MKKFFSVMLVFLLAFVLIACGPSETEGNGNGNGDGNGEVPGDGNGDENGTPPTEIVIMHGAPNEVDPRRSDFSGREKAARIALHDEVEKELNVKIVYKAYPADAPWGPTRQESIINWHAAGEPRADIYWLTTIWLKEIADNNAIVPLDAWMNTYGHADESAKTVSGYQGQTWGTAPEPFRGEEGLFINTALLKQIGIDDPVDLWNAGEWTFSRFKTWVAEAQTAMDPGQYAMGGTPSAYAKNMIPLNGGRLIDDLLGMVTFNTPSAYVVYDLLQEMHGLNAIEPGGSYDTGSEAWAAGDVLLHPGSLWLVRASNRWGGYEFVKNGDIGMIPFPMPDGVSKDEYIQPLSGQAIYTVATNNADKSKEELAFEVWNKVQLWDTPEMLDQAFENRLGGIFDDQRHIDIGMSISKNVFLDISEQLGISAFGATSWQVNVNSGISEGSVRSRLEEILPVYQTALAEYLG